MLTIGSLSLLISNAVCVQRDKSILYSRISAIILICCFFLVWNSFYLEFFEKGLGIFSGLLQITALTHTFHAFSFIIVCFILIINSFFPRKIWSEKYSSLINLISFKIRYGNSLITNKMSESYTMIEYPLIILFIVVGSTLLISSNDLITIFISIELQSYGVYILCVMYRDSEKSTSAGLTYFLLGGLSSCFILLSFALIYANSGNTSFDGLYIIHNISNLTNIPSTNYNSSYINISLLVMSVGFLFKIGAAPFHFWTPDVYDGIPTIVTTFVATFAKISILVVLMELIHYTSKSFEFTGDIISIITKKADIFNGISWSFTLLISSLLSLVIGSLLGLTQSRIKKLYAYSTISHLGFILLALSVNTIESNQSFIFYIMQYTITNINAFILIIGTGYSLYLYLEKRNDETYYIELFDKDNSPLQYIRQVKGYFYINPFIALSFTITLFSFVGIPPLVGFFAKQMVLSSALDKGYTFMVIVGIVTSVISAYYYLAIVKEMFFSKSNYILNPTLSNLSVKAQLLKRNNFINNEIKSKEIIINTNNIVLSSNISILISVLTLITLLFILMPQEWLNLATLLALILYNN